MNQSVAYDVQNSGSETSDLMADVEASKFEEELILASMYSSSLA